MNIFEAHHVMAHANDLLPGPVLLLGAPGVGKGTQAQLLMNAFGIPQISTGDLLRHHRARHTQLGLLAEVYMSQGQLVPDDLVNKMVADRLTQHDAAHGYILDGYPRTIPQAAWLDAHLTKTESIPVIAISIAVQYGELLHRITGRRTCPICKSIYNVYSNPPSVPGICNIEGAALMQRSDDSEEVFMERLKTFDAQTAPVIEHYRAKGCFDEIDGDREVEEVAITIVTALKRLRSAKV